MGFIDQIKQFLNSLNAVQLAAWGVWSYFILAFLVGIEGPIATLLGAVAASAGLLHPILVFIAAAIGNLAADTAWYALGLLGKMEWLLRFGKRLKINPDNIYHLENQLREHAPVILFVSKLTVSPMIPALIATGLIKYPWRRWFPYVMAGEVIWTGSLVTIGYFGFAAIKNVQLGIEHAILISSVLFIGLILYLGRRFLKTAFQNNDAGGETDEKSEE
jgi:membrane protein DedA with SNARE-associated domain